MEHRNDDDYVRKKLKTALQEELQYIEDKQKIEAEAKLMFGEATVQKMHCITDARNDAYISGKGDRYNKLDILLASKLRKIIN